MDFCNNLIRLRKYFGLTQEKLAELVGVSRQTVTKWESGESLPDIYICGELARVFGVTLDDLVNYKEEYGLPVPPKGKHFFGSVTVGERGQIVLPKKARDVFGINSGDILLVLGDEERGIAIVHQRDLINFMNMTEAQLKNDREDVRNDSDKD